jgi:hypothetical protein
VKIVAVVDTQLQYIKAVRLNRFLQVTSPCVTCPNRAYQRRDHRMLVPFREGLGILSADCCSGIVGCRKDHRQALETT